MPRAAQTATLISEFLPGAGMQASDLIGDYVPAAPGPGEVPAAWANMVDRHSTADLERGQAMAAAAIERFARPPEPAGAPGAAGSSAGEADPEDEDTRELLVTHNFMIGWFVRHALDAPDWRWLGLNQCNGGLTVIVYRPDVPASLVTFNDLGHLPPELRWTGFPLGLRA